MQGVGPYSQKIKQVEEDISGIMKKVNDLTGYCHLCFWSVNVIKIFVGVKESDTGIAVPALWDLAADKQALHSEEPLQVCYYGGVRPCTIYYSLFKGVSRLLMWTPVYVPYMSRAKAWQKIHHLAVFVRIWTILWYVVTLPISIEVSWSAFSA